MELNFIAVLVASVSAVLTIYLWYSPMFFAKSWSKVTGFGESEYKKTGKDFNYIVTLTSAFLEALVLSIILSFVQTNDLTEALKVGFLLWSGFIATTHLTNSVFTKKPLKLFLIDNGCHLAVILIMSMILTVWR